MFARYAAVLILSLGLLTTTLAAKSDSQVTVYITKTGEKYHMGSCRYLKKSKIAVTLKEVKEQGYDACSVCDPPE
jgi:competence protein ComEC